MKKINDCITAVLFCVALAVLSVLFLLIPDKDFSQQENRSLAQAPTLTADSLFEGRFASDVNTYFADQFPARDLFVRLKSSFELLLAKGENNGVLYSKNQLAVKDFDAYRSMLEKTESTDRIYKDSISAQLKSVDKLSKTLDVPLVTLVPPRTIDIADSTFGYDRPDGDALFDIASQTLSSDAGYIDTLSLLRPKYESGEYVYYRTDHHWTTLGAYHVYCEVMRSLGQADSIISADSFDIEQIQDFSGTTAARASFPFYTRDTLELWHLPDDDAYTVIADGEDIGGFYARGHLLTSDKYSVFLDGTHNVTTVTNPSENRKTLLVAKDSFANCLITFLSRHFDIVAVNLRTNTNLSVLVDQYSADAVLIVYNAENLITSGDLGNIR